MHYGQTEMYVVLNGPRGNRRQLSTAKSSTFISSEKETEKIAVGLFLWPGWANAFTEEVDFSALWKII